LQVELSTAISVGAIIFAAGGAWITLSKTAKSAAKQGVRLGEVEKAVERLLGIEVGIEIGKKKFGRRTAAAGVPVQRLEGDDS
jgi:hypothetical protein